MKVLSWVLTIIVTVMLAESAKSQSGTSRPRSGARGYGVNLTYAIYQYDAVRSPEMGEVTLLAQTFSAAKDELSHLKEKYKLEGVEIRHIREVGLESEESFNDAVLLGPDYMLVTVTAREIARGEMKLDVRVRYANQPLLDKKGVEMGSFETAVLRGGKGMFGVKYFIGAGGRQESAPIERTLLVSVTPEIVPSPNLRNRPQQISHPVDEYGSRIELKEGDRFTPPVVTERIVPTFEATRSIAGSVLLGGVVTPDGKLTNVKVIRSLDPVIDLRAVDAFRQYRFSPALLNGKPAFAYYREELSFARQLTMREIQDELEKDRPKDTKKPRRRPFPFPPQNLGDRCSWF